MFFNTLFIFEKMRVFHIKNTSCDNILKKENRFKIIFRMHLKKVPIECLNHLTSGTPTVLGPSNL